jgi:hypothetical protein
MCSNSSHFNVASMTCAIWMFYDNAVVLNYLTWNNFTLTFETTPMRLQLQYTFSTADIPSVENNRHYKITNTVLTS